MEHSVRRPTQLGVFADISPSPYPSPLLPS